MEQIVTANESFQKLRDALLDAWEEIKRVFEEVFHIREEIEREKILRETWTVPKVIYMKIQVITRKPINIHARNGINT